MNLPASVPPAFSLRSKAPRRRAVISLTPLIDVVFILLVFFMLASSFLDWRSIMLNAPAEAGGGSSEGALLVEVGADGMLRLSGQPMSSEGMLEDLRTHFDRAPDQHVLVKPGPGVPLQRLVIVLDGIVAAGGSNVSLMRDR